MGRLRGQFVRRLSSARGAPTPTTRSELLKSFRVDATDRTTGLSACPEQTSGNATPFLRRASTFIHPQELYPRAPRRSRRDRIPPTGDMDAATFAVPFEIHRRQKANKLRRWSQPRIRMSMAESPEVGAIDSFQNVVIESYNNGPPHPIKQDVKTATILVVAEEKLERPALTKTRDLCRIQDTAKVYLGSNLWRMLMSGWSLKLFSPADHTVRCARLTLGEEFELVFTCGGSATPEYHAPDRKGQSMEDEGMYTQALTHRNVTTKSTQFLARRVKSRLKRSVAKLLSSKVADSKFPEATPVLTLTQPPRHRPQPRRNTVELVPIQEKDGRRRGSQRYLGSQEDPCPPRESRHVKSVGMSSSSTRSKLPRVHRKAAVRRGRRATAPSALIRNGSTTSAMSQASAASLPFKRRGSHQFSRRSSIVSRFRRNSRVSDAEEQTQRFELQTITDIDVRHKVYHRIFEANPDLFERDIDPHEYRHCGALFTSDDPYPLILVFQTPKEVSQFVRLVQFLHLVSGTHRVTVWSDELQQMIK